MSPFSPLAPRHKWMAYKQIPVDLTTVWHALESMKARQSDVCRSTEHDGVSAAPIAARFVPFAKTHPCSQIPFQKKYILYFYNSEIE
ncbi:hypothetical protein D3C81_1734620 [compost metagenome]